MFRRLKTLLQRKAKQPIVSLADPVLGEFTFDNDLGWKKRVDFGDTEAELVIGSDGEMPSDEMLKTARMWVKSWRSEKPRILDYIRNELRSWTREPNLPDPGRFQLQSVNVLWPAEPSTCMIYLDYPGDEIRLWHVTMHGATPNGIAYDD